MVYFFRRLAVSRLYLRYYDVGSISVEGNCCVKVFSRTYYYGASQIILPKTNEPTIFDRIGSVRIASCESLCENFPKC